MESYVKVSRKSDVQVLESGVKVSRNSDVQVWESDVKITISWSIYYLAIILNEWKIFWKMQELSYYLIFAVLVRSC